MLGITHVPLPPPHLYKIEGFYRKQKNLTKYTIRVRKTYIQKGEKTHKSKILCCRYHRINLKLKKTTWLKYNL